MKKRAADEGVKTTNFCSNLQKSLIQIVNRQTVNNVSKAQRSRLAIGRQANDMNFNDSFQLIPRSSSGYQRVYDKISSPFVLS